MKLCPIILHANRIELARRPDITNGPVCSRMLLRCHTGQARIVVNGGRLLLNPGDMVFLPWRHTITYLCHDSPSFFVDGVHLVPVLPPGSENPIRYDIPHQAGHPLHNATYRQDAVIPGLEPHDAMIRARFEPHDRFDRLCQYILDCFAGGDPAQWHARSLAELLLAELRERVTSRSAMRIPPSLQRVLDAIAAHPDRAYRVDDLAGIAGCSEATLTRLFRRYCGESPIGWLLRHRIERAAILLTTTTLPIHEIAVRIGVPDPYYFSRLFRRFKQLTPTQFRKAHPVL